MPTSLVQTLPIHTNQHDHRMYGNFHSLLTWLELFSRLKIKFTSNKLHSHLKLYTKLLISTKQLLLTMSVVFGHNYRHNTGTIGLISCCHALFMNKLLRERAWTPLHAQKDHLRQTVILLIAKLIVSCKDICPRRLNLLPEVVFSRRFRSAAAKSLLVCLY